VRRVTAASIPAIGEDRRDIPVGSEDQPGLRIQERAVRIARPAALPADPFLRPASVVDDVVWLHRGDDTQLPEARDVRRPDVLRVLDAEAAVLAAVGLSDPLEEVEDLGVGAVADRVDLDLQPRPVGAGRRAPPASRAESPSAAKTPLLPGSSS
jgi:hypothetical protein